MNYNNLQTRQFSFYTKNTYKELQDGDIGVKVYNEAVLLVNTSLTAPFVIADVISASVKANTGFTASPFAIYYKAFTMENIATVISEPTVNAVITEKFISRTTTTAESVKAVCVFSEASTSHQTQIEATATVYIVAEAEMAHGAYTSAESLWINTKEKRLSTSCSFILNYTATTTLEKQVYQPDSVVQGDYACDIMLKSYEKAYKSYLTLENIPFITLSSSNYANLSYGKQFVVERSVTLNG